MTDKVDVTDPAAVCAECVRLVRQLHPEARIDILEQAFRDFEGMFYGDDPQYLGCDTPYHDIQHSLDVTLATARLLHGYEHPRRNGSRLGSERMIVGLIVSLFHDCGYIRRTSEEGCDHGAEFTKVHVARGAGYLQEYLPRLGWQGFGDLASELVHYTGFEREVTRLDLGDASWNQVGYMVGTADLVAQMADRCYLEKCRDFLYPEFVLGGEAEVAKADGSVEIVYASATELLGKTPLFYEHVVMPRLDGIFEESYRHAETYFGGRNLYMEAVQKNMQYLYRVLDADDFQLLRRRPKAQLAPGLAPITPDEVE